MAALLGLVLLQALPIEAWICSSIINGVGLEQPNNSDCRLHCFPGSGENNSSLTVLLHPTLADCSVSGASVV